MKPVDNKKIIGFDLDGVIINHAPTKIRLAREFGFELKPEETHSEIIGKIFNKSAYLKFQQALYYNPKIFKKTPLMIGARRGLNIIKKSAIPFVLISRRRNPEATIEVLKYYELWPRFFNNDNAFFVVKPEDKNIKAREMGVTHYADDETQILEKLIDVKNRFLFDNIGAFENNSSYILVKSWKELMNHFLK